MARTRRQDQPFVWGLYYYPRDSRSLVSLPLLNVCVAASIKELAAQVKVTHTYGNDADFAIEAIYAFPIPARARQVLGKVQETTEAKETYEAAISDGKQAAIAVQETPDGKINASESPAKEN
ncbi:hypothetical protein DFH06DRAFT_1131671 [Mycena polygramma]|nr:hypothetical protein DFH06DRAFT_1131671 [Mycena polygramma]